MTLLCYLGVTREVDDCDQLFLLHLSGAPPKVRLPLGQTYHDLCAGHVSLRHYARHDRQVTTLYPPMLFVSSFKMAIRYQMA